MTRIPFLWRNYALAIALCALFLSLRLVVLPRESGIPYLTFFPGVVICALLTGWRPTLLYIALAAPAGVYFFNPPFFDFDANDIILIAAFTASTLFMLWSIEWYKYRAAATPIIAAPIMLSDRKMIGGLALALILLTLLGATHYLRSEYHTAEIVQTARAHEVQIRIESLLSQVTDAETGLRGYIITGDEAFLAPYLGTRTRAAENMAALRALTQDHLLQHQRLDRLVPLLETRFDLIEEVIALRQRAGFEAARARIANGQGNALHDQIRAVLNEMRATQAQLALDQVNATRASTRTSVAVGILSLAGALAALGFTLWRLMHELNGRRVAEAEVRRLNAALNAHVGELEVRAHLAARASNTGFWDWDLHSNEVYFSPEWKSQLGYADDEITNRFDEWESRIHPDDLSGALQRVQTYHAAPIGDYLSEFRMRHRDGNYRWILARAQVLLDAAGKPYRMLGSHIDITERKEMEQAIVASAQEFRNLAEAMPQIVWVTRADGWNIYFNQPWVDYTGLTLEESYGQGWIKPFHPEDQPGAWEAWQNAVNNNGIYAIECRLRRADGVYRWWLVRGVPVLDAAGKINKWFGTCTDIEDIKQVETALREKNIELERFTYMISHDLKSPLVTIRTFLTYLEQDISKSDPERVAQDIGYIATAAEKMSRMLEELLEFSRVGRAQQTRTDVTWREIVDEALMLTAGAIATHAVQVAMDEINLPLHGERARLVQIWQNLIDNAIKFMGQQATPQIRIGVEGDGVRSVFFVCDNGVGIAPQYHAKIFGLFEKLDANAPGTGLGLALVQRIVENYGGVIHVASAGENNGTCFRFTLPDAIYTKQPD